MAEQSGMKVNIDRLFDALNSLQKSLECTICLELMTEPMKTRCGHSFCQPCIRRVLQKKAAHCPLCQKSLNRRNVSKDDHLETYIDKFRRLVIATQMDTHIDILSYLKQPRDTKESCSYPALTDAAEFREPDRRRATRNLSKSTRDLNAKSGRRADAPSTSRGAPIDRDNPQQHNTNSFNEEPPVFSGLSGVHPLSVDENDDVAYSTTDMKPRTWLYTSPADLPMNTSIAAVNNAAQLPDATNDDEREPMNETRRSKIDKSRTRTRQVKKRSADNTAHVDDTSQVNKEAEPGQLGKAGKIDAAASGLKYNASHVRIRANSANKRNKRNATRADEQKGGTQQNNSQRRSPSSTMANDRARRSAQSDVPDRSISGATSMIEANDRQSSADTNWSRVIELGKEMRPKKRRVRKLDVSIERKKNSISIVEDVTLTPRSKYTLIDSIAGRHNVNRKDTTVSNLLGESKSREQVAIDKGLSNRRPSPEALSGTDSREQSFEIDNLPNRSALDAAYITLGEGKQVRIKNLNNDQMSRIIGFTGVEGMSQGAGDQHQREEDTGVTAKHRNDTSQRQRLIVLTPEKLNQSLDEREIKCDVTRTPFGKLEPSLAAENRTPRSRMNSSAQNTSEESSSEFQSPTPGKLSSRRKLDVGDYRSTDPSPLRQLLLSSDKSPICGRAKDTTDRRSIGSLAAEDDSRLFHRSTTAKRDLISQISGENEMPVERVASKELVEIRGNNTNVSMGTLSRSIKNAGFGAGSSVKFMQLGTLIRRRDVKYFYSGTIKREQSLPAEVRVAAVYNMQQTVSRSEIEQHVAIKLNRLSLSPGDSQHSNDVTMMKNACFAGNSTTTLKDGKSPSPNKDPDASTSKENRTDPHSDQSKSKVNPARSIRRSSVLTDQSDKPIQEKCEEDQTFSRNHPKRPCSDNNADRNRQEIPCTFSGAANSIRLLSPDKDSQLRFLTIDSPMSEHERSAFPARRESERDSSVTKENNFPEAKSLCPATSAPRTQEPSSESCEFIGRFGADKKRRRTKCITDEEQFVDEASDKSDNSTDSYDDQRTIKLDEYDSGSSDVTIKLRRTSSPRDPAIVLDPSRQDARLRKYKRIVPMPNSDTESESESTCTVRNQKRHKTDDQCDQPNASITKASKEKRPVGHDTDEDLCIRSIANKWNNEHSAMQKKLIRRSKSTQGCPAEDKLTSQLSCLSNSFGAEKRGVANQKIPETNMFESNSIFALENIDCITQRMIKQPNRRSQRSQRIADPSNEDIINRVLQIDRSSQREKSSGEQRCLLHDNFDEMIANVKLPQSEDVTEQPSRNLHRVLTQQKTSGCLAITDETRDGITQRTPITTSSTNDMFDGLSSNLCVTLPQTTVGLGKRSDKENIASHDPKRRRTYDGGNGKGGKMEGTMDIVGAEDEDSRRRAMSKRSALIAFDHVDANEYPRIDKERNTPARSAADRLRIDDKKAQRATAANDGSKSNSYEDDTLMNVTQHQAQLQIFEDDLFGVPASRNRAKATKVVSQGDVSREEQSTPGNRKKTTQDKRTALAEYCAEEEDDVVENTPERTMRNRGSNVTAIKSRRNIAAEYSSPGSNWTPSISAVPSKEDTPRSDGSTPTSRFEICPLYQSTPKVAHTPAMAIKRSGESKKTEATASGSVLSAKQADNRTLENARRRQDAQGLCFVCSGLTIVQIRHVREFAERRGAKYVNLFEPGVTHVIVSTIGKENLTKSTLKYLQGIAHRKWIISYRWIEDCDRERRLLDEASYEATVQYDGVIGAGPQNSRLREKGLFEGFAFLCVGPYDNVTLDQYQDLLHATGATVVGSLEALAKKRGLRGIVIQDNFHSDRTIEHWYRTAKAAPIIVDWIVECIGQYKLFKLASYIQCLSLQDVCAIGYPRELVEDEEYSDDET